MAMSLPQAPPAYSRFFDETLAAVPQPHHPHGWRPQYPPTPPVVLQQLVAAATIRGPRSLLPLPKGDERG
ncbi:MAG TPA: hypothetical protein VFR55_11455 [Dehalococcoidia bacterium]|nr:hypothetical protein [Dehalococcoidia bacterium]